MYVYVCSCFKINIVRGFKFYLFIGYVFKICFYWGFEVDFDFRDKVDDFWVIDKMKRYIV